MVPFNSHYQVSKLVHSNPYFLMFRSEDAIWLTSSGKFTQSPQGHETYNQIISYNITYFLAWSLALKGLNNNESMSYNGKWFI